MLYLFALGNFATDRAWFHQDAVLCRQADN